MKVAILLSGQPRFCEETDLFIKNLSGATQVDWFFYLWKENSVQHVCGHNIVAPSWTTIDRDWALQKFKENLPAHHNVAVLDIADYNEASKQDPQRSPIGVYKMFRGNYQANQLRLEYEKINGQYDLVIKTRPDMAITDTCGLVSIKEYLTQHPDSVIIPANWLYPPSGPYQINDWIGIGLPDVMTTYCDAVNHVANYHIEFTAETLLACHLQQNNLAITQGSFNVNVRFTGSWDGDRYSANFGRWS